MTRKAFKIGTTIVKESFEDTVNSEVAAWYTTRNIPAGEHDLMAVKSRVSGEFSLYIDVKNSTITSENSQSLFGGVGYGESPGKKLIDTISPINISASASEFSKRLNGDGEFNFQHIINAEWTAIKDGKIEFDENHPQYIGLINDRKVEAITDIINDKEYFSPEQAKLINDGKYLGMLENITIAGSFDREIGGMSSGYNQGDNKRQVSTYIRNLVRIDGLILKATGKDIQENNLDLKDVFAEYKKQNGMVSNFPAQTVKQLLEDGTIERKQDDSQLSP